MKGRISESEQKAMRVAYNSFSPSHPGVQPSDFEAVWMAAREYYHDLQSREREVHIVFDGPPSPRGARFVDVEDDSGQSITVGEWRGPEHGIYSLALRVLLPDTEEETDGRELMPRAEREEMIAAGLTGLRCPFCLSYAASLTTERDRRGVLDQTWTCESCDEGGVVLGGTLHYSPECCDV